MSWKKPRRLAIAGQYRFPLNDSEIIYLLKRSARSKYLRLEIHPDKGLVVIAPKSLELCFIEDFILKKQDWIQKKLTVFKPAGKPKAKEIKTGETISYLGREVMIETQDFTDALAMIKLEGDRLIINLDHGRKSLKTIIEGWYRLRADLIIREKLGNWSRQMQIKYGGYKIRGQRKRWGSCSRNGNLSFNWKLVRAPAPVIDYVIVHELAHLKEMNHSGKFWNIVSRQCPQYRSDRKWLYEHDELLLW